MSKNEGLDAGEREARRLALVRRLGLLDTPPDERFDVFTRLAASVADAPVSTVSLIDEHRVWFKSSRGLPDGVTEVPRDIAACTLVAGTNETVLVIPDATRDARVASSPLVTGPFAMRFYAGVPLRAPGGEVLGSLCIIDRVPREPDAKLLRTLEDLAAGVASALRIHEMTELVLKDQITGLGNRRMFEEALATGLAPRPGEAARALGVLLLDLDRFKEMNDTLGHAGADAVLREVGQRIAAGIRGNDVAARFGGDEFALLVSLVDSPSVEAELHEIGERVLAAIRATPVMVQGQRVRIAGSVGIAFASRLAAHATEPEPEALMRAADLALYNAKRGGRNRVATTRSSARIGIASKSKLAADLRHALTEGGEGLSLMLQPLRAAREGGALSGFEALVRWSHPAHGPISPGDFVPVAERNGLAAMLDGWVLREACRIAARLPAPHVPVAVNITPSFLASGDFMPTVEEALAEAKLAPARLCIELTERVFLGDPEPARQVTDALLARGVKVALDDFGAGHASFGYLTEVTLSKIKIDGALVAALEGEARERASAILRGVIAMARELGLGVVAESVETAEQARLLAGFGADELQGWHIGRPAPPAFWTPERGAEVVRMRAA